MLTTAHRRRCDTKPENITERRRCPTRMRGARMPPSVQRGAQVPTPRTHRLQPCLGERASVGAARVASLVEASHRCRGDGQIGGGSRLRDVLERQSTRQLEWGQSLRQDPSRRQPAAAEYHDVPGCRVHELTPHPWASQASNVGWLGERVFCGARCRSCLERTERQRCVCSRRRWSRR